ncbi:MAG: ribosome biogenesis GTPase Der, partial [Pseudomonadales bacterium]|nr:ribosome biogenesis GTPase Der [Pseudomonadales bacterium]
MVPVIALVGRPNVGKSTLFNRLTKSRDAIVADVAGLTRDRQYGEAVWQGKPYIVVDTGGITGDEQGLDLMMAGQSLQAIEEADAVLFLVDARAGRTAGDEQIAEHLRKRNKHTYLIANKIDGADPDAILGEFANLGLGQPLGIAAAHGRNINPMLDAVLNDESLQVTGEEGRVVEPIGTKIAIIGRPNVGKSTLVNRMLG